MDDSMNIGILEIRSYIQKRCTTGRFVLDELAAEAGGTRRVTVATMSDADGTTLCQALSGERLGVYTLLVEPYAYVKAHDEACRSMGRASKIEGGDCSTDFSKPSRKKSKINSQYDCPYNTFKGLRDKSSRSGCNSRDIDDHGGYDSSFTGGSVNLGKKIDLDFSRLGSIDRSRRNDGHNFNSLEGSNAVDSGGISGFCGESGRIHGGWVDSGNSGQFHRRGSDVLGKPNIVDNKFSGSSSKRSRDGSDRDGAFCSGSGVLFKKRTRHLKVPYSSRDRGGYSDRDSSHGDELMEYNYSSRDGGPGGSNEPSRFNEGSGLVGRNGVREHNPQTCNSDNTSRHVTSWESPSEEDRQSVEMEDCWLVAESETEGHSEAHDYSLEREYSLHAGRIQQHAESGPDETRRTEDDIAAGETQQEQHDATSDNQQSLGTLEILTSNNSSVPENSWTAIKPRKGKRKNKGPSKQRRKEARRALAARTATATAAVKTAADHHPASQSQGRCEVVKTISADPSTPSPPDSVGLSGTRLTADEGESFKTDLNRGKGPGKEKGKVNGNSPASLVLEPAKMIAPAPWMDGHRLAQAAPERELNVSHRKETQAVGVGRPLPDPRPRVPSGGKKHQKGQDWQIKRNRPDDAIPLNSTINRPCNKERNLPTSHAQGSMRHLDVAIVSTPQNDLTQERAENLKKILGDMVMAHAMSSTDTEPVAFRGNPFLAHGMLKIRTFNDKSVAWLKNAVASLPPLWEGCCLTVKRQDAVARLVRCGLFVPGCKESMGELNMALKGLNPFYRVPEWVLFNYERRVTPDGIFLTLGIPEEIISSEVVPRERAVNYRMGTIYLRFFSQGGKLVSEPPL